MSEIIVKMTGDHIKIKGGEYVQDLCRINGMMVNENGFCSFGERISNGKQ